MKYLFAGINFWEELKAVVDIPCNLTDSGDEIEFDFGDKTLTSVQEKALIRLMAEKPMLRGKLSKFVGKTGR